MTRYPMENLGLVENEGSGDWYRRRRNHLVEGAHRALEAGLEPGAAAYGSRMSMDEGLKEAPSVVLEPWQLSVDVEDDALEPLLQAGQTVIVDGSDRLLENGGIYAVRDGDGLALWLYLVGFSGLGCEFGGQSIGTLGAVGGTFRLRGPLAVNAICVVGRVVEPLTGRSPGVGDLARQQDRLRSLRQTTMTALLQQPAARPCRLAPSSIEQAVKALQQSLADRAFADRFTLEQRLDAIDARLALIDELIAQTPADGLEDVLIKLDTLAALDVDGSDALESRLLQSAIDALRRLSGGAKRPGREVPFSNAHAMARAAAGTRTKAGTGRAAADALVQPLELNTSPRHRH